MHIAFGSMTGIPNVTLLSNGVINPTIRPYGPPRIYPHSNTGMCMGQSIFPTAGICMVINGRISPIARNNAAKTVFRTVICFFILSSSTFQILFALIVPHLPFSSPFILTNVCVKFYANFYLFVLNYTQR